MEMTMAATPKARREADSPLAFPVPVPPRNTARMIPVAQAARPTRRTTVRVPKQSGSLSDSLAGLASFVENAPLPSLPDSAWTVIGRAWFFIAGATAGILLALALIAMSGPKSTAARGARTATASGTARVLVVQRAPTAADRGIGALAENDLDDVAPAPPPAPPVRRTAAVVRRPAVHPRTTTSKDILSAGL